MHRGTAWSVVLGLGKRRCTLPVVAEGVKHHTREEDGKMKQLSVPHGIRSVLVEVRERGHLVLHLEGDLGGSYLPQNTRLKFAGFVVDYLGKRKPSVGRNPAKKKNGFVWRKPMILCWVHVRQEGEREWKRTYRSSLADGFWRLNYRSARRVGPDELTREFEQIEKDDGTRVWVPRASSSELSATA